MLNKREAMVYLLNVKTNYFLFRRRLSQCMPSQLVIFSNGRLVNSNALITVANLHSAFSQNFHIVFFCLNKLFACGLHPAPLFEVHNGV